MGEFFWGWRRRVGVVTLLLACLSAGGWIRSGERSDFFAFNGGQSSYSVHSIIGHICLARTSPFEEPELFEFDSVEATSLADVKTEDNGTKTSVSHELVSAERRLDWRCFHFCYGDLETTTKTMKAGMIIFPYWSITVPLTVLSMVLLLTKPPKSHQMKIAEPVAAEGT